MTKEKYALLDTDFISKTHLIRKDDQNKMIDRVMELPEYRFYCHEQIRTELARHDIGDSPEWLETKISDGAVHCISDEEIIDELHAIYSDSAEAMYANMLRNGCEAYESGYFEKNFTRLRVLDYQSISKDAFLQELKADCDEIGEGNNLGELKSYVLLQTMSTKLGEQVYVFCSDDKNARMLNDTFHIRRVILCCGYVDMRCGMEGLAQIVGSRFKLNPYDKGTLFLFCGKRTDRIKMLLWMGNGFILMYRRFEDGHLSWPRTPEQAAELTEEQYHLLMRGFDPITVRVKDVHPKKVC